MPLHPGPPISWLISSILRRFGTPTRSIHVPLAERKSFYAARGHNGDDSHGDGNVEPAKMKQGMSADLLSHGR